MTEIKFMDYRLGIAGRVLAIVAGIIALSLYFYQGDLSELTQKILASAALLGMTTAILSRERLEDERMNHIRMRTAIYALTTFIGTTPIVLLWLLGSDEEAVSITTFAIISLAFYLIVLEISKRVA